MPVKVRAIKYSSLPKFGNRVYLASTRPMEEGRIAIVTNAGRAAVDVGHFGAKGLAGRATVNRGLAHANGVIDVRPKRVVLTPAGLASSGAVMWWPTGARIMSCIVRGQ